MSYLSTDAALLKINCEFGATLATGTLYYTGSFFAFQAINSCICSNFQSTNIDNYSAIASGLFTIPQGLTFFGNFTGVTLSSGVAMLYKH